MNYLSLLYVCCFAFILIEVNGEESVGHILALLREKCAAEKGLEKHEISRANAETFLKNPKIKCYLSCMAENLQLFKEDNSIDGPKVLRYLSDDTREKAGAIVLKCVKAGGILPDRCEVAYNGAKCVHEESFNLFKNLDIFDPIVAV